MDNPYLVARKALGLTQSELANTSKVTTQVVTNLEKGLFYKPPVAITRALETLYEDRNLSINPAKLQLDYTLWVRQERYSHRPKFPVVPNSVPPVSQPLPPWDWVDFRHQVHNTFRGFCRALVFQPSMLAEFEYRNLNRSAVHRALREVGYSEFQADLIISRRKDDVLL